MLSVDVPAAVLPYNPAWPRWFALIRSHLEPVLWSVPHTIDHIGSTAVPGLAAKPIIDVDVVVPDAAVIPLAVSTLANAGWEPEGDGGITGRETFRPRIGLPYHHLYVVVEDSPPYRDHVDLRDYLRGHPHAVLRYAAEKRRLAPLLTHDRAAYAEGKSGLITQLLAAARTVRTEHPGRVHPG